MSISYNAYTATASQTSFAFTFPYLAVDHVKVSKNGVDLTTGFTVVTSPSTSITLGTGAAAGDIIKVYRLTPGRSASPNNVNLVDFVNGSVLSEEDLDRNARQLLYLIQEAQDVGNGALSYDDTLAAWNAAHASAAAKISNVATPVASADAATKGYVDSQVGSASVLVSGTLPAARLPASGVAASTYGDSTTPLTQVSVDSTGRITSASERAIVAGDLPVHTHTAANITDGIATFGAASHTHTAANVTDFATAANALIDTKISANAITFVAGGTANWDAESKRITNVATPVVGTDAVNLDSVANLALYGNAAAALPQSWNLTTGAWTNVGGAGANTIWEQDLTLSPAAVGTNPNLFLVILGGVLQFPSTAYRTPAPDTITLSATGSAAPATGVSVQVRNFGVSRAFSANADASNPGVVTIGTNIDVASGVISVKTGTTSDKGVLSVGSNLAVTAGAVSVPDATTSVKGVVSVGTNLAVTSGAISVGEATTAAKGVMQVGGGLSVASGVVSVNGSSTNTTALVFANTGLKVQDTNSSHQLILRPASDLTSDRSLNFITGDASRNLTLSADTTLSGTNSGDQTITLTGDVTGTGTGTFTATIANSAVTVGKMANLAANTILGNATGAAAAPTAITCTAAGRALLDDASAADQLGTLGADAKYAQLSGGANAAFSNPPTLATAASAYNSASQIITAAYFSASIVIGKIPFATSVGQELVSPYATSNVFTFKRVDSGGATIQIKSGYGTWAMWINAAYGPDVTFDGGGYSLICTNITNAFNTIYTSQNSAGNTNASVWSSAATNGHHFIAFRTA